MPYKNPSDQKAWWARNRHRDTEYHRRYYAKPRTKELRRQYESARRARKREAFVEHVDPAVVYVMHGDRCGICSEFVLEAEFHVDHVIPLACGGLHMYANVQLAHPLCNSRKGHRI